MYSICEEIDILVYITLFAYQGKPNHQHSLAVAYQITLSRHSHTILQNCYIYCQVVLMVVVGGEGKGGGGWFHFPAQKL